MYRVYHNGYNVEFFSTAEEVENFIANTLKEYEHLGPKEIYRSYGSDNQAEGITNKIKSVIVYQYRTLYTEMFLIEEN